MATVDDLFTQALQLTDEERTRLAHELLLTVDGEPSVDSDAEGAWDVEIARRARGVLEGTTRTESWADLKARLAARQQRTR